MDRQRLVCGELKDRGHWRTSVARLDPQFQGRFGGIGQGLAHCMDPKDELLAALGHAWLIDQREIDLTLVQIDSHHAYLDPVG